LGVRERREREREEVRGLILDAARELFAAEGIESVSMRKIAERIEYSPTAIYFHFRDKETLLHELCDHDFRAFSHRFAELLAIADPIERLRRAGHTYIRFGLEHPSHYRLMFMTPKFHDDLSKPHDQKGNPEEDAYAFLRGLVAEAIGAGRLKPEHSDIDLVSQLVWSGVHGVISLEIAKCNDPWVEWTPVEARAKAMVEMIIESITRPRRAAPRAGKGARRGR
jgi:AcrR family transcriptional regulator